MKKAHFITFEGGEGSGKSTQVVRLQEYLSESGMCVAVYREPGSTGVSERLREILLHSKETICPETELFLYCAARHQFIHDILRTALSENDVVICDRFSDSTRVYQGYALGLGVLDIEPIVQYAQQGIEPDLTLILDVDPEEGLARLPGGKDRIEQRSLEFHKKIRDGYLSMAVSDPERVRVISPADKDETQWQIQRVVDSYLKEAHRG